MASSDRGVWEWLTSISSANWIAAGSLLVSLGPALWAARKDLWNISDARQAKATNDQRQVQQDIRAQEQSILEWHKGEILGLRKQLAESETERDKWEAIARWWYGRAHDMLGQLREARHLANSCTQMIASLIARNVVSDPGFTELSESEPRLPARIESIDDKA